MFVKEFPILCNMMEADCKGSKKKRWKVWDDIAEKLGEIGKCEKEVLILLTLNIVVNFCTIFIQQFVGYP